MPSEICDDPDEFDSKDWVMRNIRLDDPIELRRKELRDWAESSGFRNVEVRNLGGLTGWEMRFECRCQIDPDRFVAVVEGRRIATRFFLQP